MVVLVSKKQFYFPLRCAGKLSVSLPSFSAVILLKSLSQLSTSYFLSLVSLMILDCFWKCVYHLPFLLNGTWSPEKYAYFIFRHSISCFFILVNLYVWTSGYRLWRIRDLTIAGSGNNWHPRDTCSPYLCFWQSPFFRCIPFLLTSLEVTFSSNPRICFLA